MDGALKAEDTVTEKTLEVIGCRKLFSMRVISRDRRGISREHYTRHRFHEREIIAVNMPRENHGIHGD